jgi:hypothetical protein
LLSPQEKTLRQQLAVVFAKDVVISNGKFSLTANREDFRKTGLPDVYYDIAKKDIGNLNNWIDTTSFPVQPILDSFSVGQQRAKVFLAKENVQQ